MKTVDVRSCPKCKSELTHVIDSRVTGHGWIRRRRVCMNCDERWSTYEVPAEWIDVLDSLPNLARKIDAIITDTEEEDAKTD